MSVKLMAAAWELDIPSTEKMVLLCLCDFANDSGEHCWPAISTVAKKCSASERTVQRAIRALEALNILATHQRRGTSSQYKINPRQIVTPDKVSPLTKTTGGGDTLSPKPSRTIKQTKQGKHPLPANWEPAEFGPKTKSRKIVDGWPPGYLEEQLERFAAHHRKLGNKFDDWQAAWSTWVLNSREFKHGDNFRRGSGTGPDKRSGLARAIDSQLGSLPPFP